MTFFLQSNALSITRQSVAIPTHLTVFFYPLLFDGFRYCDNSILRKRRRTIALIISVETYVSCAQLNLGQNLITYNNLNTPADANLSRCASVLFCYLENSRVA